MGAWGLRGEAWRSPTHLPHLPLSRGTHRATSSKVQRAASLSQAPYTLWASLLHEPGLGVR